MYELSVAAGAPLPQLDYLSAAAPERDAERVSDDHECLVWLRRSRPLLEQLADSADDTAVRHRARATLAMLSVCDSFSLSPVPAWRNYQEFLARASQNQGAVADLIAANPRDERSAHSQRAPAALLDELPAQLNDALDRSVANADGVRAAEEHVGRLNPTVPACAGAGAWLVVRVPFLALEEGSTAVWRGDEEVPLSQVSPIPVALSAIEVMRPRYFVFFVPFEAAPVDATKEQRREIGARFLTALTTPPQS